MVREILQKYPYLEKTLMQTYPMSCLPHRFFPALCYFNLWSVCHFTDILFLPLTKAASLFHIAWSQLERMYAIDSAQSRLGNIYRSTPKFYAGHLEISQRRSEELPRNQSVKYVFTDHM